MKRIPVVLVCAFLLSGCLHSEDHLTINPDGSAVLETHLKVHRPTMQMIDSMLGGMMQAFQAMGQKPGEPPPPPPPSMAEQMFGDRKNIEKRIAESGIQATIESFGSETKDDGMYVDYVVKASDAVALGKSGVMGSKVKILRNDAGDWFCRVVAERKKQSEGRMQQKQFEQFKESPNFKAMPEAMQKAMTSSALDFRVSVTVTMPAPISETGAPFTKDNDRTASAVFSLSSIMDADSLTRMAASASKAYVRTGSGPVPADLFTPEPGEEPSVPEPGAVETASRPAAGEPDSPPAPLVVPDTKGKVKVHLKTGKTFEGAVLERGDDHVKIDYEGTPITYYRDEIESIE